MSISQKDREKLTTLFFAAENNVRSFNPLFQGGFETIKMQATVLKDAAVRLTAVRKLLKSRTVKTITKLRELRLKNERHVMKKKSHICALDKKSGKQRKVTKRVILSPDSKRSMIDFENEDFNLRNQLSGLEVLEQILDDSDTILSLRIKACRALEKVEHKWYSQTFEVKDGEKLEFAHAEVVDGSNELEEINKTINLLEQTLGESKVSRRRWSVAPNSMSNNAIGKDDMCEDATGKDATGEDDMGENTMGEDYMGDYAMGDDDMIEDAMYEDAMPEDYIFGDSAAEGSESESSLYDDCL